MHPYNYLIAKSKCYPADDDFAKQLRDSTIRRITATICVFLTWFRPLIYDGPGYLTDRDQRHYDGGDYDRRFFEREKTSGEQEDV